MSRPPPSQVSVVRPATVPLAGLAHPFDNGLVSAFWAQPPEVGRPIAGLDAPPFELDLLFSFALTGPAGIPPALFPAPLAIDLDLKAALVIVVRFELEWLVHQNGRSRGVLPQLQLCILFNSRPIRSGHVCAGGDWPISI